MNRVLNWLWRALAHRTRIKPAFVIIGAQRGGTTSLYNYLCQHPRVVPAEQKEIHFFDKEYRRGLRWYYSQFPSRLAHPNPCVITGEATPYYLFHPLAARRMRIHLPHAKLIVLLRNPVDRAYSHYQFQVRIGCDTLSFEDAIDQESERLRGEQTRIETAPDYYSFAHQHHSYLSRGKYVEQLARWFDLFPREQFLILKSETFYADPGAVLNQAFAFLSLPSWKLNHVTPFNQAQYDAMAPQTRARLAAYFAPHNRRLSDLLGADFRWEAEQ